MKSDCRRMVNVLFKPISRSISKRDFGKLFHSNGMDSMSNLGNYYEYKYVIKDNRISLTLGGRIQ